MNLGNFYANTGKYPEAESAYRKAIHLQPSMIQASVNLADLYRVQNADSKGEVILKQSLQLEPQNAEANLALHLAIAAQQGTDPHYSYLRNRFKFRGQIHGRSRCIGECHAPIFRRSRNSVCRHFDCSRQRR